MVCFSARAEAIEGEIYEVSAIIAAPSKLSDDLSPCGFSPEFLTFTHKGEPV